MPDTAQRHGAMKRKALAAAYGAVCHILFAAGVGMMMAQMYAGMSRGFGSLAAPWSFIANALLLAQFPLAHSFLLSQAGRNRLARCAPRAFASDLAPTTYVIIASAQVFLLFSLWTPSGVVWWEARGAARWLLTALYAASWLLLGKAILDAGVALQSGALGWLAVFRDERPRYPGMPSSGLFRFCRQPIYLAFALTLWTVPVWTPDQLALAVALTAYCLIGPLFKERRFARIFGQAFADYRRGHPYFLPTGARPARNDLAIYDTDADHWWDGSRRWLRALQNIVPARLAHFDTIAGWRGAAVLDIGCGGGFMAEAMAKRGARVTGIDPAAKAIAAARAHAAGQGLAIRYETASGEALPLADASMDVAVCVDVLEHVEDVGRVLDEIRRVLKPGGLFCFDTINRNPLATLVVVVFGERILRLVPMGTHDPAKFIRPRELASMLAARGFSGCAFHGMGPVGVNRRLDPVFGRLPVLTIMYMGHARLTGPQRLSRAARVGLRRQSAYARRCWLWHSFGWAICRGARAGQTFSRKAC
jgi:ubiquinone biosynthesis O-methyltransferase